MGLTRALFPLLKQSPDASVIFVGESHGETPKAYWGGFGASKAALNYLCKVAADEWERFGNLRANVLVPGPSIPRNASNPIRAKPEANAKLRGRTARICLVGKCRKQRAERRNRLPLNPERQASRPRRASVLKNIRTFRAHPSRTDKHLDLNLHKDNNDNPLFP